VGDIELQKLLDYLKFLKDNDEPYLLFHVYDLLGIQKDENGSYIDADFFPMLTFLYDNNYVEYKDYCLIITNDGEERLKGLNKRLGKLDINYYKIQRFK